MQALSFVVHIPLVCFGIAFPAMVLFVHGLYLRTGDAALQGARQALVEGGADRCSPSASSPARSCRSSSACCGPTSWPRSARSSGSRSGSRASRSSSRRSSSRSTSTAGTGCRSARTSSTGIPIVISGFAGSFCVIAVNGWMNNPAGFDVVDGQVVDPQPWTALLNEQPVARARSTCTWPATSSPASSSPASTRTAHLRGKRDALPPHRARRRAELRRARRAGAGRRRRLGRAHRSPRTSRSSSPRSRGSRRPRRARRSRSAASTTPTTGEVRYGIEIPNLLSLLAYHDPNATVQGLDTVPPERPAAGQHRALRVPDDGRDRDAARRCSAPCSCSRWWRQRRLPRSPWFYRARDRRRAARARRADLRLDHDGGRPPAVDRLRDHARRATP